MKKQPLTVHCDKCHHEWAAAYLPMPIAAICKLLRAHCHMCGHKKVMLGTFPKDTPNGDAVAWLKNGDTGISSLFMWHVLMGQTPDRVGYPYDPSDFGRCYRLLKIMPAWRARLGEVAAASPGVWTKLVAHWDELTALWEQESPSGQCPRLYARMRELGT